MSGRADPSKLFQAIVVLGAGMAGPACGGKVIFENASGAGTGGAGTATSAGTSHPGSTTTHAAGTTHAATSTTGGGDPCQSVKLGDCASPAQYHCVDCGGGFANKCTCDTTAPLDPTHCKTTADFHCTKWSPPTDCSCWPGSPTSAADCPKNNAWSCAQYMPPVGCICVVPIV